jgi:hypothetical protein
VVSRAPLIIAALSLLSGCLLETATGVPVPLPREFTQKGATASDEGPKEPFATFEGDTVVLKGLVSSALEDKPVQLDFLTPDDSALGGWDYLGRLLIDSPGEWTLAAPAGFGELVVDVYQDMNGDGPTDDDPFATASFVVEEDALEIAEVSLLEGSRDAALVARAAARAPFRGYEGPKVAISGEVRSDEPGFVLMELRSVDEDGEVAFLGQILLGEPGPLSLEVPEGLGALRIQAFQDQKGDGPGPEDHYGMVELEIGAEPVSDLSLELAAGAFEVVTEGGGAPEVKPFVSYEGPTVGVSGTVITESELPVQIDVRTPDESSESGLVDEGKLELGEPGAWSFKAPKGHGELLLQAFQDLTGDGPSDDDPFGFLTLEIEGDALAGLELKLEEGGKKALAELLGPGGGSASPFADYEGVTVEISGEAVSESDLPIQIDVRTPDEGAPGGLQEEGKLALSEPGPWSIEAPRGHGELLLQAFQDLTEDGPSDDDPFGFLILEVGAAPMPGQRLVLEEGGKQALAKVLGHGGGADAATASCGGWEEATILISGDVIAKDSRRLSLDFRVADPEAEGGMSQLCREEMDEPGAFELEIPAKYTLLEIEAFQDVDQNGPSEKDPYGRETVRPKQRDVSGVRIELVVGARKPPGEGPAGGPAAGGGGAAGVPFAEHEGPWVKLNGTVKSAESGPVTFDFGVPDPEEPGGKRQIGRLDVPDAGPYAIDVPEGQGTIILEIFQDLESNGPSDDDPYAQTSIEVGGGDVSLDIELVVGARGQPSGPGGDGGGGGGGGGGPQASCFDNISGDTVQVSGIIKLAEGIDPGLVKVDIFTPDPEGQGGRRQVCQLQAKAGPYSFEAPADFGDLEIEAYIDIGSDGPTPGDPFAMYANNPLRVDDEDIQGVHLKLLSTSSPDGL